MENVRPLSTSEMGGLRYRSACEERRFPVEFAYEASVNDKVALHCSWLEGTTDKMPELELIEGQRGAGRAKYVTVDVPLGQHSVEFVSGDTVLLAKSFIVKVTDMPNTQKAQKRFSVDPDASTDNAVTVAGGDTAASRLKTAARAPPGVRMVAPGKLAIIFNEIAWARSVSARGVLHQKDGTDDCEEEFKLSKADGREWRVEIDHISSGSYWFRFEVVLGEATTASSAPMTEFGWDRSRCTAHTLVSPQLDFEVRSGEKMTGIAVCTDEIQEFVEVEEEQADAPRQDAGTEDSVKEATRSVNSSSIRSKFEEPEPEPEPVKPKEPAEERSGAAPSDPQTEQPNADVAQEDSKKATGSSEVENNASRGTKVSESEPAKSTSRETGKDVPAVSDERSASKEEKEEKSGAHNQRVVVTVATLAIGIVLLWLKRPKRSNKGGEASCWI